MSTSRIDDLRMVDPVLTSVAHGYQNANMVGDKLFPSVKVSKLKGKIPVFGKSSFVVKESIRALRAASNRIEPDDIDLIEFNTIERDLEAAIDYIEEEETPEFFKYEQKITKQLMDMMYLIKEKEAADLVQNADNFDPELVYEVPAYEAFDDYTLDVDPIGMIRTGMNAIRSKIARNPNTMIIGNATYQSMLAHPALIDRIKYSGLSKINKNVISEMLDIPNIHIGMSVFTDDGNTYSDIWNDNIVLAYVDPSDNSKRSEYNPSFGYTFQREGKPEIDTYYENGGKLKVIRNTDNYVIKITADNAGYLIKNTNHGA